MQVGRQNEGRSRTTRIARETGKGNRAGRKPGLRKVRPLAQSSATGIITHFYSLIFPSPNTGRIECQTCRLPGGHFVLERNKE